MLAAAAGWAGLEAAAPPPKLKRPVCGGWVEAAPKAGGGLLGLLDGWDPKAGGGLLDGCAPKEEVEELPKAGGAAEDPPKLKLGFGGLLEGTAAAAPALKLKGAVAVLEAGAGGLFPPKENGDAVLTGAGFAALGAFLPKENMEPPEDAVVVAGAPPNRVPG